MVLLVPPASGEYARAASAIRSGFKAGFERADAPMNIEVVEAEDDPNLLRKLYREFAKRGISVVIGPLTRNGVNALADANVDPVLTLALNQPDTDRRLPGFVVNFGLPIETEARQVTRLAFAQANLKLANARGLRAVILSSTLPLARRAAVAFEETWQELTSDVVQPIEIDSRSAADLQTQIKSVAPDVAFLALNAEQARGVRAAIGKSVGIWGTSMLNMSTPMLTSTGATRHIRAPELEGVRFVEMPWQVQSDHAAVMAYPKPPRDFGNVEMHRLYALGIDALRVAVELAQQRPQFELDGVTGRLSYDRGVDAGRIDRQAILSEFKGGIPVALVPVR